MTFASDLQQRQQLQKQYCPIKSNIEWRTFGKGARNIRPFFLAQTLVARKETIHLSRERRIMFIQYGNQNGFCVRPGGGGRVLKFTRIPTKFQRSKLNFER